MHQDEHIPDDLARQLRADISHRIEVPRTLDEAILSQAQSHLSRHRPWRRLVSFAAAAGLLLATSIYLTRQTPQPNALAMDINHDQQINILDALTLAKMPDSNPRDIEQIAWASVRLGDGK